MESTITKAVKHTLAAADCNNTNLFTGEPFKDKDVFVQLSGGLCLSLDTLEGLPTTYEATNVFEIDGQEFEDVQTNIRPFNPYNRQPFSLDDIIRIYEFLMSRQFENDDVDIRSMMQYWRKWIPQSHIHELVITTSGITLTKQKHGVSQSVLTFWDDGTTYQNTSLTNFLPHVRTIDYLMIETDLPRNISIAAQREILQPNRKGLLQNVQSIDIMDISEKNVKKDIGKQYGLQHSLKYVEYLGLNETNCTSLTLPKLKVIGDLGMQDNLRLQKIEWGLEDVKFNMSIWDYLWPRYPTMQHLDPDNPHQDQRTNIGEIFIQNEKLKTITTRKSSGSIIINRKTKNTIQISEKQGSKVIKRRTIPF